MWSSWFALAHAADPDGCRLVVSRHDPIDPRDAFAFHLELTAPDVAGRSKVVAATLGRSPRLDTAAEPSTVDWTRWPLALSFVGPALGDPKGSPVKYTLVTREGVTPEDWGACIFTLDGPPKPGCTQVEDEAGDCLRQYALRHHLGPQ